MRSRTQQNCMQKGQIPNCLCGRDYWWFSVFQKPWSVISTATYFICCVEIIHIEVCCFVLLGELESVDSLHRGYPSYAPGSQAPGDWSEAKRRIVRFGRGEGKSMEEDSGWSEPHVPGWADPNRLVGHEEGWPTLGSQDPALEVTSTHPAAAHDIHSFMDRKAAEDSLKVPTTAPTIQIWFLFRFVCFANFWKRNVFLFWKEQTKIETTFFISVVDILSQCLSHSYLSFFPFIDWLVSFGVCCW